MSTQAIDFACVLPWPSTLRHTYLMCLPEFYDVAYIINPWMVGNIHSSSRECATAQWHCLYHALTEVADVVLIEPQPGSPDMVFTANAGLERDGIVVLSSFCHAERQTEERHFQRWFHSSGYAMIESPRDTSFEGEGDALFAADGSRLWAGYGPRTTLASHSLLERAWNVEVIPLHLVDPRFYHLDTCFAPLSNGDVMYYPQAFDAASISRIEEFYAPQKRIVVTEADAVRFACNAINIGSTIILSEVSRELRVQLEAGGFRVVTVTLTEFLKAGGAAKCLAMRLSPRRETADTRN